MRPSKTLFWLSILVALLATIYAGVGLFSTGDDGPFTFTSLHGKPIEIYGQGIYHNDSVFRAPLFRGTDAVTLFVCIPTLLAAAFIDRRGSLRGRIFLTGMLAYFLYNSASLALGAAYNRLLLVYILCVSASLFAFIIAFQSINLSTLAKQTSARLPHRWIAIFMFAAGLSLAIWLMEIISSLLFGTIPAHLDHYTTEATYTLDVGVLLPTAYLAGVLIWKRQPLGTVLSAILIILNSTIGLVVASQSIVQALDGILLKPAEYAAFVAPFVTLSLIAIALIVTIFRNISEPANR
jgi:hypothetical protein